MTDDKKKMMQQIDDAMVKMEKLKYRDPVDREDTAFNSAVEMCLEIMSEIK